jgi:hypothetical protein
MRLIYGIVMVYHYFVRTQLNQNSYPIFLPLGIPKLRRKSLSRIFYVSFWHLALQEDGSCRAGLTSWQRQPRLGRSLLDVYSRSAVSESLFISIERERLESGTLSIYSVLLCFQYIRP